MLDFLVSSRLCRDIASDGAGDDLQKMTCVLVTKYLHSGSSRCGSVETNPTGIHEHAGSIPGLDQWGEDPALP